ncbi:MAG: hypothetical protein IJP39_06395 [Bacteroidales bacterium]|nr:hypothetical protein [Bacteroidales bacterium]MBR0030534.1 hypothetical protein [Bacteroidales bacterium]MBR0083365.1 hypothetical protein [Bacteroidales bacterium]MBR0292052.1 hypothetical protein [Bacteroidales bacterium]
MKKKCIIILSSVVVVLLSCGKEGPSTDKLPVVPGIVVIKNTTNNDVILTAYTMDASFTKKVTEKLELKSGENYQYKQDQLEGDMRKDAINFLKCDSLDFAFADGRYLRLYSGSFTNKEDYILENYWIQAPEVAQVGKDIIINTFVIDESLHALSTYLE